MKVSTIIQARMGSIRFPGKVLEPICGKTMVRHVVERTKEAHNINEIVVATTHSHRDDILVKEVTEIGGVIIFRGSEEDVLDRYYNAAKKTRAEVIVRITADCPLIDPAVLDAMIEVYLKRVAENKQVDYLSNILKRTFPRGLDAEVFSFHALERAFHDAKEVYQREHVTPYIYQRTGIFKLECFENEEDLSFHRWTVDVEEDLQLIREIYKELYQDGHCFLLHDVVNLFKRRPQLLEINASIKQKNLKHEQG
jgi:spore coat polysaccharide biosynthesis protein SpsF